MLLCYLSVIHTISLCYSLLFFIIVNFYKLFIDILCESLFTATTDEVMESRVSVNILYALLVLCHFLLLGSTLTLLSRCARGVETVLGVER